MTATQSNITILISKILRIGLIAVILATIVPYGAVNPYWLNLAVLLNALVFAGTLAIPFRNQELQRVYRTSLVLLLLICGYILIQSLQFPDNAFSHSIWRTVGDTLNIESGAISVDPAGTFAAIPVVAHPFLIFMGVLVLNQNNETAVAFWRRLSLIGGGVAGFGIIQRALFPRSLLLSEKLYYLDSVTGTFVNRNSAATLFGVTALMLTVPLVRQFRELYPQRGQSQFATPYDRRNRQIEFVGYLGLIVVVLLALFLTKSRGGLISTLFPLLLIGSWFGYSLAPPTTSRRLRMAVAGLTVTLLMLAFGILGARSLFRIEQGGAEDSRWCVYGSVIDAIKDNPWLGTGFGTFEQVFPAYRDPKCGISGLWDRAHNVFLEGYLGLGLPFAVVILFGLAYLLSIFLVGYRTRQRFRIVPLTGMGILLLAVLHSIVDFSIQIPGVAAYIAAALGAAVSISLARKRSRRGTGADLR
jgi:O-antigen ligase